MLLGRKAEMVEVEVVQVKTHPRLGIRVEHLWQQLLETELDMAPVVVKVELPAEP
jgi:hypothetical protein